MATKIYLGQLMHFSSIAAVESHDTSSTGIKRIGVKAPDLEDLIGSLAETAITDPAASEATLLGLIRGLLTGVNAGATQATALDMLEALQAGLTTINGRTVQAEHTFHDAISATDDGTTTKLTLGGANRVLIGISRSSITENVISFKATAPGGVVGSVIGYKIGSDGAITVGASSSALTDEVWMLDDLAGYTDVYVSVDNMTGTSITVKGKAVA